MLIKKKERIDEEWKRQDVSVCYIIIIQVECETEKKDEKLENRNETSAMIHESKSSEMKFN